MRGLCKNKAEERQNEQEDRVEMVGKVFAETQVDLREYDLLKLPEELVGVKTVIEPAMTAAHVQ